jgi:hypothetical protein
MLFKNLCILGQPVSRHVGGESAIRSFQAGQLGEGGWGIAVMQ